jgi:hypothetical protein
MSNVKVQMTKISAREKLLALSHSDIYLAFACLEQQGF